MTNLNELRRGIVTGAIAGAIWGIFALLISSITQVFEFDFSILHGLFTFGFAGMGLGIVAGALYSVVKNYLPFKNDLLKAGILSTGIWLTFFGFSLLLSGTSPDRYHFHHEQSIQGLLLSVALGLILGMLWKNDGIKKIC